MGELFTILLLTILQFATGFAVLNLINLKLKGFMAIAVSVLLGVAVNSLSIFFLILLKIPLTSAAVFGSLIATLIILLGVGFKKLKNFISNSFTTKWYLPKIYELPAIGLLAFMIFVSAWRCYYFPPTPRDLTSGPEVIAEYAIKEKTIANSIFSVNLESTNNQFKSPYITTLQVLYKYAGFPFGQVWLSVIFAFFIMFLYKALAKYIHPVLAGMLCVWFICIPEMYAYTIMALFDYSNAVYFAVGVYFLLEYGLDNKAAQIASGLFFALATYIRSETLVLIAILALVHAISLLIRKEKIKPIFIKSLTIGLPSLFLYFLAGNIYLNNYLPQKYEVANLVNKNLGNLTPFTNRLSDIINLQLFNDTKTPMLYGSFVWLFVVIAIVDVVLWIIGKKYAQLAAHFKGIDWINAAIVVVVGLAFLGYLLPLMDLNNSTKRGLFKLFPILLLYMMHSNLLQLITKKIKF
jgi:hypothetical protein